jgi:hypothetical protein
MAIRKSVRIMFLVMNTIFFMASIACVSVGAFFATNPYARRNAVVSQDNIQSK